VQHHSSVEINEKGAVMEAWTVPFKESERDVDLVRFGRVAR